MNFPLLSVTNLSIHFPISGNGWLRRRRLLKAVDQVSFDLAAGEILGIVGESGCGKSTLARAIVGLVKPASGHVYLNREDLTQLDRGHFLKKRRQIQLIFQDPLASLDPRMTIGDIVAEPLREFNPELEERKLRKKVASVLDQVGILPNQINRYPHQFSGGQCQRVGIARALISEPSLILCDEAVSALDVSIQAQIVNLLLDLKEALGLSLIFISHDLRIVRQLCDRIVVMYLGRIVETNSRENIYHNPGHPYTKLLIDSVPKPDPASQCAKRNSAQPSDYDAIKSPQTGCSFFPRCPLRERKCAAIAPSLEKADNSGLIACHFPG